MTPTAKLSPLLLVLLAAACGSGAPDGPDGVGEVESEIAFGTGQSAANLAVGLIDDGGPSCSGTLIEDDLMLSFDGCSSSGTVSVGATSSKVRIRRYGFGLTTDLVSFQTFKRIGAKGYARGIDTTPLVVGDTVTCVGYDDTANPKLRSGSYEVIDGSSANLYYLESRGAFTEVTRMDRGGYCSRDGATEIAAILSGESVNGVAKAIPLDAAKRSIDDIRRAASAARGGTAVRFRATTEPSPIFLTDSTWRALPVVDIGPLAPTTTMHQAFYLEPVSPPPGGGFDWYRLINSRTGRCLSENPATHVLTSDSCRGRREEVFQVESLGNLQYRIRATGGCVDQGPAPAFSGPTVFRCNGAPSQGWEMWLTRF